MPNVLRFAGAGPTLLASAKTQTHAVMEMYGVVGGDYFDVGITAKDVVAKLKDLPTSIKTMDLHINSPGGSVFEGMAIYNRLKQYGQKVAITVHVDALAASIASIIAMAGAKVVMSDAGFMMIHKPWTMALGNSDDLEKTVSTLDDIENQMINLYAKKTKLDRLEIKDLLAKETWLDADEAIRMGFADEKLVLDMKVAACINPDMKWLARAPKAVTTNGVLAKKAIGDLETKIKNVLARK